MTETPRKHTPLISLLLGSALLTLAGCGATSHHRPSGTISVDDVSWQLPDDNKQARVRTSQELDFPAEQVWSLIAGFNTLADYHASIVSSELLEGGAVRHVTLSEEAGGGVVVERLVYFNDETRTFSYKIIGLIDCDLAMRNYQARVHLIATGPNSCLIEWESNFDVEGASLADTEELARTIYQGCYDGIARALGDR